MILKKHLLFYCYHTCLLNKLIELIQLMYLSNLCTYPNLCTYSTYELIQLMNLFNLLLSPTLTYLSTSSTPGSGQGQTGAGACKVNCLLQAYISRLPLTGFALGADMVYVRQSAARLFRALFDLTLKRGWSKLALRLLGWCQMVERRVWRSW